MDKNTPELWDKFWENNTIKQDDIDAVKFEEYTIRWQRIEKIVLREFGSFKGLKVLEIGGGIGTNSALMAMRGAKVHIMDYSIKALQRSRLLFEKLGLKGAMIEANALELKSPFVNKFDITMSFGLAEHFTGEERIKIIDAHFSTLKKGGLSFISVPNKHNPPYRVYKFFAEVTKFWSVGEEYPYSRTEFKKICKKIAITNYSFFGDSFYWSLNFINPVKIIKKLLKKKYAYYSTKKERGSWLDPYISYALILSGKR